MSEVKWTPGPWECIGNFIYAKGSVDTYSGVVMGGIASVDSTNQEDSEGRNWSTSGCREANASLMAASPDLYDALEDVLNSHEIVNDDPLIKKILSALAKARGET